MLLLHEPLETLTNAILRVVQDRLDLCVVPSVIEYPPNKQSCYDYGGDTCDLQQLVHIEISF